MESKNKTLEEHIVEMTRQISVAIEEQRFVDAESIYRMEYLPAIEIAENIWECR